MLGFTERSVEGVKKQARTWNPHTNFFSIGEVGAPNFRLSETSHRSKTLKAQKLIQRCSRVAEMDRRGKSENVGCKSHNRASTQ
jgi:hypothetical protein